MLRKISTILFLLLSYANLPLSSHELRFNAGDHATYVVLQEVEAYAFLQGEKVKTLQKATIELNIKIIEVDENSLNFPFDVEVVLTNVSLTEKAREGLENRSFFYDTKNPADDEDSQKLGKALAKIIDVPLLFHVSAPFQVEEMSGKLADFYENYDLPSGLGYFGFTPWTYEFILTQLFHLSDQDLNADTSYPVSCYQLINWEDDGFNEDEINVDQTSVYKVDSIDDSKIAATWKGKAKITDKNGEFKLNDDVSIVSHIEWNMQNPLFQSRTLEADIRENVDSKEIGNKLHVQQTWVLKPKK